MEVITILTFVKEYVNLGKYIITYAQNIFF